MDALESYMSHSDLPKVREFIEWLKLAEIPAMGEESEAEREIIEEVERIGLTFTEFRLMDEKPGYFGYDGDWHMRLRRVRNRQGSGLFDALEKS